MVYAETSEDLYTFDPFSYDVSHVGGFTIESSGADLSSVTDLALDRWRILYAISFSEVYVCNGLTAACTSLTTLPESFNAMTLVPAGTVHADRDALVVIANSGNWSWVEVTTGALNPMGAYGGYGSSGDVFSIVGVGTFGAATKVGEPDDVIVSCDPLTGAVNAELAVLDDGSNHYTRVYGLAGWAGKIFAFDESGAVLEINPTTGAWSIVATTPHAWWGAGITTVLF